MIIRQREIKLLDFPNNNATRQLFPIFAYLIKNLVRQVIIYRACVNNNTRS